MEMEMKKMMIKIIKMMLEKACLKKSDEFEKDDEDEIKVNNIEVGIECNISSDPCGYDDGYNCIWIKYKGEEIYTARIADNMHRDCPIQQYERCEDNSCEKFEKYGYNSINEKYLKKVNQELDNLVNQNWDNLVREKIEKRERNMQLYLLWIRLGLENSEFEDEGFEDGENDD